MKRLRKEVRRRAPLLLAVAAGAAAGLGAAAAVAAPVAAAWQTHVLPAFAQLLGTLIFC